MYDMPFERDVVVAAAIRFCYDSLLTHDPTMGPNKDELGHLMDGASFGAVASSKRKLTSPEIYGGDVPVEKKPRNKKPVKKRDCIVNLVVDNDAGDGGGSAAAGGFYDEDEDEMEDRQLAEAKKTIADLQKEQLRLSKESSVKAKAAQRVKADAPVYTAVAPPAEGPVWRHERQEMVGKIDSLQSMLATAVSGSASPALPSPTVAPMSHSDMPPAAPSSLHANATCCTCVTF
jgi:hypothetical protein